MLEVLALILLYLCAAIGILLGLFVLWALAVGFVLFVKFVYDEWLQ